MTSDQQAAAQQPDEEHTSRSLQQSGNIEQSSGLQKRSMPRRRFLTGLGWTLGAGGIGFLGLTSIGGVQAQGLLNIVRSALTHKHKVDNQPPALAVHTRSFASEQCVKCLVLGDWGTGDAFQKRVAQAMAIVAEREHPQFVISTGDNFYPSGVESAEDKQFQTKWKNVYNASSLNIPWIVSLGNHDYRKSAEAQIAYSKKDSMWLMPARYYTIRRQEGEISCEVFVLDTEGLVHGSKAEIRTQLEWFEQSLKSSNAMWKIAVGHHMIRSHGAYGDQSFMLNLVKPLLDRYGVQVYLNGHDHDLQYLKAPEDSFICVISGAGGGARNTSYGKNTRFAATNGGFVYLAATKSVLHLEFYNAESEALFAEDAVRRG